MKRRWVVAGAVAIAVCGVGAVFFSREKSPAVLTVLTFGGSFEAAQRAAFYDPFERATGHKIVTSLYHGEYEPIKTAIVSARRSKTPPPFDIVDVEGTAFRRGIQDGLFQKIDQDRLDKKDLLPETVTPYGVATDYYAVSLGWNANRFPAGGPQPQSWADFWDVERFPGPRALKLDAKFTLEIALLADGVPAEEIYSGDALDLDRAFRSLDRIRPYVTVWWTDGQEPIEMLSRGEVVLAAAFGERLYGALNGGHAPIGMTWKNGIVDKEYWAVPRGDVKVGAAMDFIEFASRAEPQAVLAAALASGPVNRKVLDSLPAERSRDLMTAPENLKTELRLDPEYWSVNEEAVRERFDRWLAR